MDFYLFVFLQANCYYHGEVEGHVNSDVSLSICSGIKYVCHLCRALISNATMTNSRHATSHFWDKFRFFSCRIKKAQTKLVNSLLFDIKQIADAGIFFALPDCETCAVDLNIFLFVFPATYLHVK